jgi:hypothetical protein
VNSPSKSEYGNHKDENHFGWPTPQPLISITSAAPFPTDSLPEVVRNAVLEVQKFVQAPVAMVATCALSTVSLACQAIIDVERANQLVGPVSLFTLVIAESGERKTTCDGFFGRTIRQFEREQEMLAKPLLAQHRAEKEAWEAEYEGLRSAIKKNSSKGITSEGQQKQLAALEKRKPGDPKVPQLSLSDETPESLAWTMSSKWPSRGILSSEGGVVFGGHAMGADSAARNLALLNVLWDGGTHSVGRRSSESFQVKGARLTMGVQIQEKTLQDFMAKTGDLARGSGFFARFLLTQPASTQGTRLFCDAPKEWPSLDIFNRRILQILSMPVRFCDDGSISPEVLSFAPEAKCEWVKYFNEVEQALHECGKYSQIRDVASKSADNAARLAALFHFFENGVGAISGESVRQASRLSKWYLDEALRILAGFSLPKELADAAKLDMWITDYCKKYNQPFIGKNYVRQFGPLRDGARLDCAIEELGKLDRLKLKKDGKCMILYVNPSLL